MDPEQLRMAASDLVLLASLFDGLCGDCSLRVQERLSRLASSGDCLSGLTSSGISRAESVRPTRGEGLKTISHNSICTRDDSAANDGDEWSSGDPRSEEPRPGSEEQSSVSDGDEETSAEVVSSRAAALPARIRVSEDQRAWAFHIAESHLVRAGAVLSSAAKREELACAPMTPERSEEKENRIEGTELTPERSEEKENRVEGTKLTAAEKERRRLALVERKKDFVCLERVRGRPINIAGGLELHCKVFSKVEQEKLIQLVMDYQERGRKGLLRKRTYSEPRKWMPGKGRVTIQFGCCYNYAVDSYGNPPGIMQKELVDPIPRLLQLTILRLVKWGVLPDTCVPDSCIINIYDVGDCIPPHIDHHDFVRPFCTLSLVSECSIIFGSKLSIVGDGLFDGPLSISLPVGSVLVLQGNGADVAKHAVPGVPTKRISITFRKMDPEKVPVGAG